jgi:hypothetical protein
VGYSYACELYYTHFCFCVTKATLVKHMQIVDKLQWYIQSGDTVNICSYFVILFGCSLFCYRLCFDEFALIMCHIITSSLQLFLSCIFIIHFLSVHLSKENHLVKENLSCVRILYSVTNLDTSVKGDACSRLDMSVCS